MTHADSSALKASVWLACIALTVALLFSTDPVPTPLHEMPNVCLDDVFSIKDLTTNSER